MPLYTCCQCGHEVTTKTPRLPRGWKDISGSTCDKCVKSGWYTKCIKLPVREVVGGAAKDFFSTFTKAWRLSTDLANWAQRRLLVHDVVRSPDMTTLPKFEAINLYKQWNLEVPLAVRDLWDGSTQSAATILRAVESTWKSHPRFGRLAVIWRGESSPATYRWPYPWPVPAQSAKLSWAESTNEAGVVDRKTPRLSITLPGGRVELRLDHGPGFRRFLGDFERLVSGQAILGEVKIVGRLRGGKLKGVDVRIAGKFRRKVTEVIGRVAEISTASDAALKVLVPDQEEFILYYNHLPAIIRRYEANRHRLAVDTKFEKRWPAAQRRRFVKAGAPRIAKQDRTITTLLQQIACAAVGYALRQRCDTVTYDDSIRTYAAPFRWHQLKTLIQNQCGQHGLRFVDNSTEPVEAEAAAPNS